VREISLSIEQLSARQSMIAATIPITRDRTVDEPKFLGLTRFEWVLAPDELAAVFGLSDAREKWRRKICGVTD
jgi:hypothetical protein